MTMLMMAVAALAASGLETQDPSARPDEPVAVQAPEPAQPGDVAAAEDEQEEEDDGGRIVGGSQADRKDGLWQAEIFAVGEGAYDGRDVESDTVRSNTDTRKMGLVYKPAWERNHRCGGALIPGRENWVLTAAHCVYLPCPTKPCPSRDLFLKRRGVRLGTLNIDGGGRTYRIERAVVHKWYDPDKKIHDIALLKIVPSGAAGRFDFTPVPIRILGSKPKDLAPLQNPFVAATGWGLTSARADAPNRIQVDRNGKPLYRGSPVLKIVSLKLLPQEGRCKQEFPLAMIPEVLCAGSGPGKDTCQGDSGGPLTRAEGPDRVLVGLVSNGKGCAIKGMPGLYVNVTRYLAWIDGAKTASRAGRVIDYVE